jgi:preprotein translocase subunit SecA
MSDLILSPATFRGFYPERRTKKESKLEGHLRGIFGAAVRLLWTRSSRLQPMVEKVNALDDGFSGQDDEALRNEVLSLRQQVRTSKGLTEDLAVRALALSREAAHRSLGMRPFDVQIMGAWALLRGMVAEMETGEGKTLTAAIAASTAALAGIPVHIITVNDYLAQRDALWMGPLYEALGLTCGSIVHGIDQEQRQASYRGDVLYGSNKEIVFDYLKDRLLMGTRPGQIQAKLQRLTESDSALEQVRLRGLPFAIIDEADSVLIDEARTPLIISGQSDDSVEKRIYSQALEIAEQLRENVDYTLDPVKKHLELSVEGKENIVTLAAEFGGLWTGRQRREELTRQALSAIHLYERDRDYIVREDRVQIVDEYTGRVMGDRSWERGLHQLIEAKEGTAITSRTETLARISYQRFFRRYHRLAGMTGTASEVAGELFGVYGMQVVTIPTNRNTCRSKLPSKVYGTEEEKWRQIVDRIEELHEQRRPVLVGTRSVAASEHLASLLEERGIAHNVLNARQDAEEAEIIGQAGQASQVTVATNMAGRGTDIKLGPGVVELGGLHVLATEYHDARRIDRQLFGRCGRQGDPGSYEMIASLEDYFLTSFSKSLPGKLAGLMNRYGGKLAHRMGDIFAASTQRKAQQKYSMIRRELLRFDESLESAMAFSGKGE